MPYYDGSRLLAPFCDHYSFRRKNARLRRERVQYEKTTTKTVVCSFPGLQPRDNSQNRKNNFARGPKSTKMTFENERKTMGPHRGRERTHRGEKKTDMKQNPPKPNIVVDTIKDYI